MKEFEEGFRKPGAGCALVGKMAFWVLVSWREYGVRGVLRRFARAVQKQRSRNREARFPGAPRQLGLVSIGREGTWREARCHRMAAQPLPAPVSEQPATLRPRRFNFRATYTREQVLLHGLRLPIRACLLPSIPPTNTWVSTTYFDDCRLCAKVAPLTAGWECDFRSFICLIICG
jgi:hypothetical protein